MDLEVTSLRARGQGREQGHLVGEEGRAAGGQREVAATGLDRDSLPGQLDLDLPELAVVLAPGRSVGDLVIEPEVGRDLLQPLAEVVRVRDQEAAGAFGEVAERAARVQAEGVLRGVEGLDLVAGDGAVHAGVLQVAGGGGLTHRGAGGGEVPRGVEAAHVHGVDADARAVGLADRRPEQAVEIRRHAQARRKQHDCLATGQLFLGLEQGQERPERRLSLLLALDEIGRAQGDGLDLRELSLHGLCPRVSGSDRTDDARSGRILGPSRIARRRQGRRCATRRMSARRIELPVVVGRELGLRQHALLRVGRRVRDQLDRAAKVLGVARERLDQAQPLP